MATATTGQEQNKTLVVPDTEAIRQELGLIDPTQTESAGKQADAELEKTADQFIASVMAWDPNDSSQLDVRESNIAAVEQLGSRTQQEAARRSAMLKQPIKALAEKSEDGGQVARSLIELNTQVDQLDPGNFDFKTGWFARTLGRLPGFGTPLQQYFTRFQQADTIIDAIIRSLQDGRGQLGRDNTTLALDQKAMRQLTIRLQKTLQLGQLIDQRLVYALERDIAADDPRRRFVEEELLFPLRQRLIDLQQQLAVNQQGILAIELIIRNNKELIKGVDRAVNVTVSALTIAVTVALALANQKIVLDKIAAVNKTTSKLIEGTANQLRTQGVAIQKQATEAQLDIESLTKAFTDIRIALDDISKFRRDALPAMARNIVKMDTLTEAAEAQIRKMEQGNKVAPSISLDVSEA
ncbi:MAG: toxic anion resistance protein [Proteobacteria bacterium]|nr:toxic anion resistance protein [Pseudomonadota bacterium]